MTHDFNIGQKVREARITAGMTQAQLGEAIGTTQNAISLYESGQRHVGIETLLSLCTATNHPLAHFLGDYARGLHAGDDDVVGLVMDLESFPEIIGQVIEYVDFLVSKRQEQAA